MNKKYIDYLFKNRRIAVVFFLILYLGISLSGFMNMYRDLTPLAMYDRVRDALGIGFSMSMILAYALPVLQFSYVHSKKSVDLFFAMPVSRRDQLLGNILFCFAVSFGYFVINAVLAYLLGRGGTIPFDNYLIYVLAAGIYLLVMIVITSMFYLLANNVFDGIVMIGAYSALPLLIWAVKDSFISYTVAGMSTTGFDTLSGYFSPLYMISITMDRLYDHLNKSFMNAGINPVFAVLPVIMAVIAAWLLKRHFVDREAERADQVSDQFFAYPFVIHIYAFLILVIFGFSFRENSIATSFLWYVLLLFVYIVATFVYKRKIEITPKYLIRYGVGVAVTLLLGYAAFATEGFGMARKYTTKEGNYLLYTYDAMTDCRDLGKQTDREGGEDWINGCNVSVAVSIPTSRFDDYREVLDMIDQKRQQDIDWFYGDYDQYRGYQIHTMFVNTDKAPENDDDGRAWYNSWNQWHYSSKETFTEDQLKYLAQYGEVTIWPNDYEKWPYEDGQVDLEQFIEDRGK